MPSFSSPSFKILAITYPRSGVVRVRFTFDPLAADADGGTDALNPANYVLTGSHLALPISVVAVGGDPQAVDIAINVPLATGTWRIAVSNVVSLDGDTLVAPTSLDFEVSVFPSLLPINGGAIDDDSESTIRKHVPSLMSGPGWTALIAAVAAGDAFVRSNALAAFDQIFRSSASGIFLDRRGSDFGVTRPTDMGISDESFQDLLVRFSTEKVTRLALLDLLEVFYGSDSLRATIKSQNTEPFALEDGWTLELTDGLDSLDILFEESDFAQIGAATADEICAIIDRTCLSASLPIRAEPYTNPISGLRGVQLTSLAKGIAARVKIVRGLAQNGLLFPTELDIDVGAGSVWSVSIPEPGILRYTLDANDPVLLLLREGDIANITGSVFDESNRGSLMVSTVRVAKSGLDWDQWFEVDTNGTAQTGPLVELGDDDVRFFRCLLARPDATSGSAVLVAQASADGFDVRLPATSRAVARTETTGAHTQPRVVLST